MASRAEAASARAQAEAALGPAPIALQYSQRLISGNWEPSEQNANVTPTHWRWGLRNLKVPLPVARAGADCASEAGSCAAAHAAAGTVTLDATTERGPAAGHKLKFKFNSTIHHQLDSESLAACQ